MKRVLRFLIYLYPAWWRRRYGRELEALLEEGYSAAEIRKIYGENTLRLMEAVERTARAMR